MLEAKSLNKVAHDFRGPLVTIEAALEICEEYIVKGGLDKDIVLNMINNAKIQSEKINRLLATLDNMVESNV